MQGYSARDNEHLNHTRLKINQQSVSSEIIDVPYEWFESDSKLGSGDKERVLILWLNEDKIVPVKYGNFIRKLFDELKKIQSRQFNFSVIGPTNTSLLVELIKQKELDHLPASFKIISSSATISDCDIHIEKSKSKHCSSNVETEIKKELAKKSIIRTIGQDPNLAKALLWELEQRGVNSKNIFAQNKCEDGIVLISERDTLYARALTNILIIY